MSHGMGTIFCGPRKCEVRKQPTQQNQQNVRKYDALVSVVHCPSRREEGSVALTSQAGFGDTGSAGTMRCLLLVSIAVTVRQCKCRMKNGKNNSFLMQIVAQNCPAIPKLKESCLCEGKGCPAIPPSCFKNHQQDSLCPGECKKRY